MFVCLRGSRNRKEFYQDDWALVLTDEKIDCQLLAYASGIPEFFVLATSLLRTIYRCLDASFLFSQLSVAKIGFSVIAWFEMRELPVCMYGKSIFVFCVISYFSLSFFFMSVFIYRKSSFLISCRL